MSAVALVVADLARGFMGHARPLDAELAGRPVLHHTLARAARIEQVTRIVLVHPEGQDLTSLVAGLDVGKPLSTFPVGDAFAADSREVARYRAARKWTPTAWRGGVGGAMALDELLPAAPLAAALQAASQTPGKDAAYIIAADWCCFDPAYATGQLKIHLEAPEQLAAVFTQAPPGLSGVAVSLNLLQNLAENKAGFGPIFNYNSRKPAIDPIGREANFGIDAAVRDCGGRFVYDTPRARALLDAVAETLGPRFAEAGAADLASAMHAARSDTSDPAGSVRSRLPGWITVELTPQRPATGPIAPQHHVTLDRPAMTLDCVRRIAEQLADPAVAGDTVLLLGGLGDPLMHPEWREAITIAHEAGVTSIGVETDLQVDPAIVAELASLPVDVLSIRLNADSPETYAKVTGLTPDAYARVTQNFGHFFEARAKLAGNGQRPPGLPFLLPRLIKTPDTLPDMEMFFERWMQFAGHAVIEPATTGCGLMPAQSPVPMEPPMRRPCAQLPRRMSVLSSGVVALCDQDWLGRDALGSVDSAPLLELWQKQVDRFQQHRDGQWSGLPLCAGCPEWHRP